MAACEEQHLLARDAWCRQSHLYCKDLSESEYKLLITPSTCMTACTSQ